MPCGWSKPHSKGHMLGVLGKPCFVHLQEADQGLEEHQETSACYHPSEREGGSLREGRGRRKGRREGVREREKEERERERDMAADFTRQVTILPFLFCLFSARSSSDGIPWLLDVCWTGQLENMTF